ncbi:MAG TPA: hypothetical protein VL242_53990, partial [Sorangium sp.]|nr:hypothetical protein [Sorangium sp.]
GEKPRQGVEDIEAVRAALRALPALRTDRVQVREGARWRAVVSTAPCAPPEPAPGDAGAPEDAGAGRDGGAR